MGISMMIAMFFMMASIICTQEAVTEEPSTKQMHDEEAVTEEPSTKEMQDEENGTVKYGKLILTKAQFEALRSELPEEDANSTLLEIMNRYNISEEVIEEMVKNCTITKDTKPKKEDKRKPESKRKCKCYEEDTKETNRPPLYPTPEGINTHNPTVSVKIGIPEYVYRPRGKGTAYRWIKVPVGNIDQWPEHLPCDEAGVGCGHGYGVGYGVGTGYGVGSGYGHGNGIASGYGDVQALGNGIGYRLFKAPVGIYNGRPEYFYRPRYEAVVGYDHDFEADPAYGHGIGDADGC